MKEPVEKREVTLPFDVEDGGLAWQLYHASWGGADGKFGLFFYAISMDHAAMVVDEIRASLKLDGQMKAIIDGPNPGDREWRFDRP